MMTYSAIIRWHYLPPVTCLAASVHREFTFSQTSAPHFSVIVIVITTNSTHRH